MTFRTDEVENYSLSELKNTFQLIKVMLMFVLSFVPNMFKEMCYHEKLNQLFLFISVQDCLLGCSLHGLRMRGLAHSRM